MWAEAVFIPHTEFKANIPPNTHLVTSEFVRALRGISSEAVQDLVESGQLRFVWNVTARPRAREISELRFWLQETIAPIPFTVGLRDAVQAILGARRTCWRGTEIAQMMMVSRPCIHRLRKSRALPGKIKGSTLWVQRSELQRFLNIRWLGKPMVAPG